MTNYQLKNNNINSNNIMNIYNINNNYHRNNINNINHRNNFNHIYRRNTNFSNDVQSYNLAQQCLMNKNGQILLKKARKKCQNFSPDIIKYKNYKDNAFDLKILDFRGTYRSTSNRMEKKRLNYNNDYIEDLKSMNHITRNINNFDLKRNKNLSPKFYNMINF